MKLLPLLLTAATAFSTSMAQASDSSAQNLQEQNFYKLDFDIHRGSNTNDMAKDAVPHFAKRDGSVDVEIKNERSFYMASLQMGSNNNKVNVLVDTGSSDLWVMSHDVDCVSSSSSSSSSKKVIFDDRLFKNPKPTKSKRNLGNIVSKVNTTSDIQHLHQKFCFFNCGDDDSGSDQGSYTTIIVSESTASGTSGSSGGSGGDGDIGGGYIGGGAAQSSQGSASNTCTQYGSLDTSKSDTFKRNNSASSFEISYGDGTSALGVWGHDNVKVGNATVRNLSFAVVNETDSNVGVLGIGLPGLETTYSSRNGGNYQYENLPLKMKNEGIIHKSAYSLYLGESSAKSGSVLFGAVDHAKYSGELQTVPVVNTLQSRGYEEAIRLEVAVDSISVNDSSNDISVTNNRYTALLDSGSTLSYFPTSLLRRIGNSLGGRYSSSVGAYQIDCNDGDSIRVSFDFSGARISVPLSDLTLSYGSSQCFLGILQQQDSYILLGDNVLRNAYLVYDLDDYEISIAQAKYTSDEDIEVISSSVPSATQAKGYSSTQISSVSEASATQTAHMNGDSSSSGSSSSGSNRDSGAASVMINKGLVVFTMMAISAVIIL